MKHNSILIFIIAFITLPAFTQAAGINKDSLLSQNISVPTLITYTPPASNLQKQKSHGFLTAWGIGLEGFSYSQPTITNELYLENDKIKAHSDSLVQDITTSESQLMIRPEIWVFPYLNIYGLFGYSQGNVTPDITAHGVILELPFGDTVYEVKLDTTIKITEPMKYNGIVYGFGITGYYDYNNFFIELDYNYTEVSPQEMDSKLVSHRISPKAGYLFSTKNRKNNGAVWIGGSWLNNIQTLTGVINVREFAGDLADYLGEEADYTSTLTPVHKWNMIVGGSFTFNNHFNIALEAGFIGRKKISLGFMYRF